LINWFVLIFAAPFIAAAAAAIKYRHPVLAALAGTIAALAILVAVGPLRAMLISLTASPAGITVLALLFFGGLIGVWFEFFRKHHKKGHHLRPLAVMGTFAIAGVLMIAHWGLFTGSAGHGGQTFLYTVFHPQAGA
jgi:hypothetical protein